MCRVFMEISLPPPLSPLFAWPRYLFKRRAKSWWTEKRDKSFGWRFERFKAASGHETLRCAIKMIKCQHFFTDFREMWWNLYFPQTVRWYISEEGLWAVQHLDRSVCPLTHLSDPMWELKLHLYLKQSPWPYISSSSYTTPPQRYTASLPPSVTSIVCQDMIVAWYWHFMSSLLMTSSLWRDKDFF